MVILDIDPMITMNYLLRQIKGRVNFDFIYEKAALTIPMVAENLSILLF